MFRNMCEWMTLRNSNVTAARAVDSVRVQSKVERAERLKGEERGEVLCCKKGRRKGRGGDVPFKSGATVLSVL